MEEAKNQLKVLHVASGDLWAGAEVQIYTLLRQLATQCQIYAVVLNHGTLAEKLAGAGIETAVLDETQYNAFSLLRQLLAVFNRIQPDVVHTHRTKENILAQLAGKFAKARSVPKFIKTVHGSQEHAVNIKSHILQSLDRYLSRNNSTRIISVSRELEPTVVYQNPGTVVTVIENGIDQEGILKQSKSSASQQLQEKGRQVGFIGRLVPVKRVDIFLHAIAQLLAKTNEPYHFHIVGDGPLLYGLQQLSNELSIESHITFHGHRSDIPAFLASIDTVIMCSEHEGTPMIVLEAIAMGKRLVLHDTGGLTSIARLHHLTPYSPNSPETLVQAIMKAQPPTALHETYTIERCASQTLKLYMDR